jgi:hypothetical protein
VSSELIDRPYGDDLETIAPTLARIVEHYFVDADGLVLACLNARTNKPYVDDDPEVRDLPLEQNWVYRGAFPHEVKRTAMNYEDADMTTGELLMAYLARARVEPTEANVEAVERLAGAMIRLNQVVADKNPFGAGFLPKPHGGLAYVPECFELSADQYLKWAVGLEAYAAFTRDTGRRDEANTILLDMARWLDARDFATPYMGNTNYGRLNPLRHYHLTFAYLCAKGYALSGDLGLLEETVFFKEHALANSRNSTAPNSQNLVVEALGRLLELAPEHADAWLELMRRDWDGRNAYVMPDLRVRFADHYWNHTTRFLTSYLVARRHLPEAVEPIDTDAVLLEQNTKDKFLHMVAGQEKTGPFATSTYPDYDNHLEGLAYASWLRVYWETR